MYHRRWSVLILNRTVPLSYCNGILINTNQSEYLQVSFLQGKEQRSGIKFYSTVWRNGAIETSEALRALPFVRCVSHSITSRNKSKEKWEAFSVGLINERFLTLQKLAIRLMTIIIGVVLKTWKFHEKASKSISIIKAWSITILFHNQTNKHFYCKDYLRQPFLRLIM